MSIEKLNFSSVERDPKEFSFTTVLNKVIQNLHNAEALGLWIYLSSLPSSWSINKQQLRNHFNWGRDKLDKCLRYLIENKLISVGQKKSQDGKFCSSYIQLSCGYDFKSERACENKNYTGAHAQKNQCAQEIPIENNDIPPRTENPGTGEPVTGFPTPINKTNINKNKKKKLNILYASDDARVSFQKFWSQYPRKKDKLRAEQVWLKSNCHEIEDEIIADIIKRSEIDHQWQDKQYIPYPAKYLSNQLWNDEITPVKKPYDPMTAGLNIFMQEDKHEPSY